jgi:hypothetical protein
VTRKWVSLRPRITSERMPTGRGVSFGEGELTVDNGEGFLPAAISIADWIRREEVRDMDEHSYDLLAVGSGTGMLAALTGAEADLSVLIVEKSEYVGGSTALSGGGFWIPNNSLLREAASRIARTAPGGTCAT